MDDRSISGFELGSAVQRGECGLVPAQPVEAAGQVDVCGRVARQELRCAFERLMRLGKAAELQPGLAEQVEGLAGIGTGLRDLRQQRLRRSEVSRCGAPNCIAGQGLDLGVGK